MEAGQSPSGLKGPSSQRPADIGQAVHKWATNVRETRDLESVSCGEEAWSQEQANWGNWHLSNSVFSYPIRDAKLKMYPQKDFWSVDSTA